MNGDTADEQVNQPPVKQSEKLSEQVEMLNNSENINQHIEAKNMEVHHHTHDPSAPHAIKNWKSYIWEFLMLFLAVFCSFLAEYYLEHRIEKERGVQYIKSMIEDIASDAAKIDVSIAYCKKQKSGIDSLSAMFNKGDFSAAAIVNAHRLMSHYTMQVGTVSFTKRTISQLKHSGGMRLISNKISADEITKYSEFVEMIEFQGDYFINNALNEVVKLNKKLYYLKYINTLKYKSNSSQTIDVPNKFATNDSHLWVEYNNSLIMASAVLDNYTNMLISLKPEISKIIAKLKQENHIE